MTSPAQQFLDRHWPEEWPSEFETGGYEFYDSTLKDWEQEREAAIQDRWIEFRDEITSHLKRQEVINAR